LQDNGGPTETHELLSGSPAIDNGDPACAGDNLDDDATGGFSDPTDLSNTPALLGPLADNGGVTRSCLPQGASPLVDAYDTPCATTTDQRSVARVALCDIGALEQ